MTDTNCKLYTAKQVRGIDYAAIHESGIAGYELMSRAAKAVVEDARKHFPSARNWLVMRSPWDFGPLKSTPRLGV